MNPPSCDERSLSILAQGHVYTLSPGPGPNYLHWFGTRLGLVPSLAPSTRHAHHREIAFFYKELMQTPQPHDSAVSDCIVYARKAYPLRSSLFLNSHRHLRLDGRGYNILAQSAETPFLPPRSSFHDDHRNLGYLLQDSSFYWTTKVEPYTLRDPDTGADYRFGEALIGIPLKVTPQRVIWQPPLVLTAYSHPALPGANTPRQVICNGTFSYEALKARHPLIVDQLRILAHKSRQMLTEGYTDPSKAWHRLSKSLFESHKIRSVSHA